jgi:hypothetical protein
MTDGGKRYIREGEIEVPLQVLIVIRVPITAPAMAKA